MSKYTNAARRANRVGMIFVLSLAALCGLWSGIARAAQTYDTSGEERKVIKRVVPEYPDALRRLYIGGVVRVEVLVNANGTVKSTKLLGGSPILGQSTMKAIMQWKYAPAATESTVTVKVEFDPHH
jgi:TonB family protein